MTVAIGALCDGGKSVVVAADKMITFGPPMNLLTEPPTLSKIVALNTRCLMIFSGSVPDGEEIVAAAKNQANNLNKSPVSKIADIVKNAYVSLKSKRVEETILAPMLSATFAEFKKMVSESATSQLLQQIAGFIMQHNLQLEILLAGTDDSGAHLFIASHPGVVAPADILGFGAIGSGGLHAAVRLALGQHTKSSTLPEAIFAVYQAKKAADVAPGVGKLTDLALIKEGKVHFAGKELLDILEENSKDRTDLMLPASQAEVLKKACDEQFK